MSRTASRYSVSLVRSRGPSAVCEAGDLLGHRVENAAVLLDAGQPRLSDRCCRWRRTAARRRRAGCSPSAAASSALRQADRVGVGAAVAGVAARPTRSAASSASSSDASCVSLAELLRGDLVHRDAGADVGAFGLLRVHAGQERGLGAGVVARRLRPAADRPACCTGRSARAARSRNGASGCRIGVSSKPRPRRPASTAPCSCPFGT